MTSVPSEDPQVTAIEQLEAFGLSAYAARTFVALAALGTGTARDVSEVSAVPRTHLYDAIEELHERGPSEATVRWWSGRNRRASDYCNERRRRERKP